MTISAAAAKAQAQQAPTATKAKASKSDWSPEMVEQSVKLYNESIEAIGLQATNTNIELAKIAKEVGAKSANAVRSKLASKSVGAYQTADKARSVRGVVRTQKVHYVRALQEVAKTLNVELTGRQMESLEHSVATDLQLVIDLVAAATGREIIVNPDIAAAATPKA